MKLKIIISLLILATAYICFNIAGIASSMLEGQAAVKQARNDNVDYAVSVAASQNMTKFIYAAISVLSGIGLAFVWVKGNKNTQTAALSLLPLLFVGCGQYRVDPIEEIETNETAFVIPLEGDTNTTQEKFESVEYLENKKVATKRITVSQKKRSMGRLWWNYEWIPTMRVVKVDRTPVTRKWVAVDANQNSGAAQGAIAVESLDSIGFAVGVNISAFITEEDTATYLYYYRSKSLEETMDTNIRAEVQSQLSNAFGSKSLEECKSGKNLIVEQVRSLIVPFFEKYGISITTFGLADGLEFEDPEIQIAITKAYVAEMGIKQKEQEKLAQEQENERLFSIAENERKQAEEFSKAAEERAKQVKVEIEMIKANALQTAAEKWDGTLPKFLMGSGGGKDGGLQFLLPLGEGGLTN